MSYEFPLVFFTVLTQLGVGMAMFMCWNAFAHAPDSGHAKTAWIWIFIVTALGLVASLFHLGHPFHAYKALYNLGVSWLSREGLGFSCFCALAFVNIFVRSRGLVLATALVGACSLVAQGFTYSPPSMPAIHNVLPMALFWLSALSLGGCAEGMLYPDSSPQPGRLIMLALILALLAGPALWISGTATMAKSSVLWAASPWFWLGLALIVVAFIGTWFAERNMKLQFAALLFGIVLTRMVFFADTIHTASNMGLPFN